MPFEIPESWEWTTFDDIADSSLGKMLDKKKKEGIPLHYLRNINVRWGYFDLSDLLEMPFKAEEKDRYSIRKGDLVICEGGEPGRCAIWDNDTDIMYQKALHRMRPFYGILNQYLSFVLMQYSNSGYLEKYYTGSTIKHLTGESLSSIPVPIPSYHEQLQIVSEIGKWFTFIDSIDESKSSLQSVIEQAKSKVLQLAVSGKLVPQELNDEPATEMLKLINPNIQIPCDNPHYPFDIPQSWCWVHGNQVFAPMQSCTPKGNTFKYIDIDTIDNKNNNILAAKILPTKDAPSRASRFTMKDDTLFSMVRPYLRNIAMVQEDDCIASTGFYVCRSNGSLLAKYCFYMMLSSYVVDGLNFFMKGDNSPSINRSHIESFLYPLPSLAEQKRIVSEIERYFNALDKIKESLTA